MNDTEKLLRALYDVRDVIQSRFRKEADCPSGDDYSLGYVACAKEIDLRVQEIISNVTQTL